MKLQDRMRLSIRRRAGHVVLRSELMSLGSASQVSLVLKLLQHEGELVRLGVGVYAKAHRDAQTGAVTPEVDFETLTREAAAKLKMLTSPKTSVVTAPAVDQADPLVLDTGHRRVSRKLALEGRQVSYINDRSRSQGRSRQANAEARVAIPTTGVAQFVRALARKHKVSYARTPMDQWAETVTRLAGDEVRSGVVQDLLIALKRAGKLSTDDMTALLVNYLRERKQDVRSV